MVSNENAVIFKLYACVKITTFDSYRRFEDLHIDITILMEYIEELKFKSKTKHDVYNKLPNMNHPDYNLIGHELP